MKVSINIESDDAEVVVEIDNAKSARDAVDEVRNMSGEVVIDREIEYRRERHRIAGNMLRNASDAAMTALFGEGVL